MPFTPSTRPPTATEALFARLGIEEHEANICDDTWANRRILRQNDVRYVPVPPPAGITAPSGLLEIILDGPSIDERNESSYARNKFILVDPEDPWSNYINFLELPLDFWNRAAPWMLRALRKHEDYESGGTPEEDRQPLPQRCRKRRGDGSRCWNWAWPTNHKSPYHCRTHGPYTAWNRTEEIQRLQELARLRLAQLSDDAVDVIDHLMHESKVDQVRLRAATEALDRAGLKPGQDITINGSMNHEITVDPGQVIRDRLAALAKRIEEPTSPIELVQSLTEARELTEASDAGANSAILDAEVVEDDE